MVLDEVEDESTMFLDDEAGPSVPRDEQSGLATDSDEEDVSKSPAKRGKIEIPPEAESTIRAAPKNRKKVIIPASSMAVRDAKARNKTGNDLVKIVMRTNDASIVTGGLLPLVHNVKTNKVEAYNIEEHIKERTAAGRTKDITAYEIFGKCVKLTIEVCKRRGVFKDVTVTTMKRLRPIMWNLVRIHQDDNDFLELWRNPLMGDDEPVTESGWYLMLRKYKANIREIEKQMDKDALERATNKLSNMNV